MSPERVSAGASITTTAAGLVVLAGWMLDIELAQSVVPGLPKMMPNSALGLAVAGIGLGLLYRESVGAFRWAAGLACSVCVALLGFATLLEYLLAWDVGIDRLLLRQVSGAEQNLDAGRPSFQTALSLFLIGLGLCLLDVTPRRLQLSHLVTLLAILVALLALIGYACGVPAFYGVVRNVPSMGMALHMAILVVWLGIGVLCARPRRGLTAVFLSAGPGGSVARRLLLAPVLVPLVLGWLRLAGQRAGIIQPELGGWIFALSNIVVFTLIIWWSAQFLYGTDIGRTAAERKFRAVAETATDAIVSADGRGRIIYLNPSAEKMFGYFGKEAIGEPLTLLMPERFRAGHQRGLARFLATRESQLIGKTIELIGKHKSGREFPVDLSLATWQVEGETFFSGILRDIQERKDAEEAVRQANLQLALANQELEAFSYSVSHDLRAPLRSIDGFSQALEEDYGGHLDTSARDHLGRIRAATRRMGHLIDDLINLSRVSRKPLEPERVDLSTLARSIARELHNSALERAVNFQIAAGLEAKGDSRLLRVALENLLSNAWKYTATHARARIEVGMARGANGAAAFFVRDDGVGFDMAYAPKLFAPFQRLHGTAEFAGTGIGLATVQRILHRHGGRIWAEAAVGKGATFFFTLPMEEPQ